MTIGGYLTQIRQGTGLTRAQWANAAGVTRMTIYRWETGLTIPHAYELSNALVALEANPKQRRAAFALRESERGVGLREMSLRRERLGVHRGDLLRALRGRRGWTSEEVARQTGVGASVVRKWEALHSWPDDARVHRLAYALGASAEELLALSGGIGELESLAPPTFREMFERVHALYFLPAATHELEPSLFAMAHRARIGGAEAEGIADFPIGLGVVHAGLLFREGRVQEARRRFQEANSLMTRETKPWTRLAAAHAHCFMLRGNAPLPPGSPTASLGRRLWEGVREASSWEGDADRPWRAALASERAFALWYAGDGEEALAESARSLALGAGDRPAELVGQMSNRARLLYEMGRHEQALDELVPYLGLRPDIGATLHLYLGLSRQALGHTSEAHDQLTLARDLAASRQRAALAALAADALSRL